MVFTAARKEDEVPETNKGPAETVTDDAASSKASGPLPGFGPEMMGFGYPDESQGEPAQATAVETSAEEKAPDAAEEKPKAPEAAAEKPDPAKSVNFDGLSDESKAYWENALKTGHAKPADVDRARKESLFQASWTRNHQRLAKEREAFEKERTERKEDLAILDRIRADDRLHAAFLKAAKGEIEAEASDDIIDGKRAAEIARKAIDAREAEKADRAAKEQATYESKKASIRDAIHDQMPLLGVTPEVMLGYLKEEEASLNGEDPILTFTPAELTRRIAARHEKAEMSAKIKSLESELSQRASKAVQASKQSLPPARRAPTTPLKGMAKTLADLGVARLSDVPGFGFPSDQQG